MQARKTIGTTMTTTTRDAVAALLAQPVPAWTKALPPIDDSLALEDVGTRRWRALVGDLPWPIMLLKGRALEHNIDLMARFCAEHGLDLAPHGKTTMAPQIVHRQLDAGAWGVTVATATQARLFEAFGVRRIIIANELLDPVGVRWVSDALARDPELEMYCLVDSPAGVERIAELLPDSGPRLAVLLELGVEGQRAGCRTIEDALTVVDFVTARPQLQLAGVETFEGVIGADRAPATVRKVDDYLAWVRDVAERLMTRDAFADRDEVLLTAGGSTYPDRVAAAFGASWDPPQHTRRVLRSGCYVTHDHGLYETGSPFGRHADGARLKPALEVWGVVLSRPEPDLAIVGFGRRDVPYDAGLPVPVAAVDIHGTTRDLPGGVEVVQLNDQHAFVHVPGGALEIGELLGCGISHPCTAFDKWDVIPVVDDAYVVTGAVRTFF
jgi:D-serine dehydratase